MSKSQLHAFIDRARSDEQFRSRLSSMNPKQIVEFAAESGFNFSDEIKGRFINRWKGVYFCPQAIEVGILCPGLVPAGYKNLIHYSQSTYSSSNLKEEEHDFRSGGVFNLRKLDFEEHAIKIWHSFFGKSGLEATFLDTAGLN